MQRGSLLGHHRHGCAWSTARQGRLLLQSTVWRSTGKRKPAERSLGPFTRPLGSIGCVACHGEGRLRLAFILSGRAARQIEQTLPARKIGRGGCSDEPVCHKSPWLRVSAIADQRMN
jgi:hypothetical protein